MSQTINTDIEVDHEDLGGYEGMADSAPYYITSFWVDKDGIISGGQYSYSWSCGDGCCSDTHYTDWSNQDLSTYAKAKILHKHPQYVFEENEMVLMTRKQYDIIKCLMTI